MWLSQVNPLGYVALMHLYGFSFLRNGLKYDYPFRESLQSLLDVTEASVLVLGKSEDGTENAITRTPVLTVESTVWDDQLLTGGLVLSQQTNLALNILRRQRTGPDAWGLYLQADEIIHEGDIVQIHGDFAAAERSGCDVICFRYIHFWERYDQIAVGRKWYPHEIRGVKLRSSVESWGDAQSFRGYQKIYFSDAPIYHYGHVRNHSANEMRKSYFLELHHGRDEKAKAKSRKKELRKDRHIPYLGPHPLVMKERMGEAWDFNFRRQSDDVYVLGRQDDLPASLQKRVVCRTLRWIEKTSGLRGLDPSQVVVIHPHGLREALYDFRHSSRVGRGMDSPLSRPWPTEFWGTLKFSERGFGVRT